MDLYDLHGYAILPKIAHTKLPASDLFGQCQAPQANPKPLLGMSWGQVKAKTLKPVGQ